MPKNKKKRKKQKKIKRINIADAVAIYEFGIKRYLQKGDYVSGLKYLQKAAELGIKKAYGEIGLILYREKHEANKAEKWFIKAEKADALSPEAAYEYGMLYYLEKDDWETGLNYLFLSANQGYELAYGEIGIIFYLEANKTDEAEEWFKKAEKINCLLAPAAYYYGLFLILERGKWNESIAHLQNAAEGGFDLAFGQLGTVLYLEKAEVDEAEKWFKKAEKAGCLAAPHAHEYGMLLIKERGNTEKGDFYLKRAADEGYDSF